MQIEQTVNKHRGALLIAIGGFLVFLYIRHKRQQAAAAAAAQAAAAAAAAQDPGTMDQNTYDKQFSQPAPAYLGSPFSGYGANAPNYPPPTQLQPNPAASSAASTVAAATGGGPPTTGGTGQPVTDPIPPNTGGMGFIPPTHDPIPPNIGALSTTPPKGMTQAQWDATRAQLQAGSAYAMSHSTFQAPIDPSGHPSTLGQGYWVPQGYTIGGITGYVGPQVGTGLFTGAAGEPGTAGYMGIGYVPPAYR